MSLIKIDGQIERFLVVLSTLLLIIELGLSDIKLIKSCSFQDTYKTSGLPGVDIKTGDGMSYYKDGT